MTMRKNFVIASLVLSTACYEYNAFQPTMDTVGRPIRVQLSSAGTTRLAALVGPDADYVDGNLTSLTDSTYTISLVELGRRNGSEESWRHEPVTLSKGDVESIELRKASPGRTAALTAIIAGGAALVARAIGAGEGAVRTRAGGPSPGQ
ncbi:MAG: hypothetical protein ACJ785_00050 [Gemmatimonadaceae bacterium]